DGARVSRETREPGSVRRKRSRATRCVLHVAQLSRRTPASTLKEDSLYDLFALRSVCMIARWSVIHVCGKVRTCSQIDNYRAQAEGNPTFRISRNNRRSRGAAASRM